MIRCKPQIEKALREIQAFSLASCLNLNSSKCEILGLDNTEETSMRDRLVKKNYQIFEN